MSTTPCNSISPANCSNDTMPGIGTIISSATGVLGVVTGGGVIAVITGLVSGSLLFGTAELLAALIGALAVIGLIALCAAETCTAGGDKRENQCMTGVVAGVNPSFNSAANQIFPFTASHNELDLVTRTTYYTQIEKQNAFVWCNNDVITNPDTDNSEIVRCYYNTPAVCNAIIGSEVGAVVGGAAGVALVVVLVLVLAIGCAVWWTCILALLVAAIIAAVAALSGAFVGGQIGKAASGSDNNTTAGNFGSVTVGDIISCTGPLLIRAEDNGANVFWWVLSWSLMANISSQLPTPFRYCDVENVFNPTTPGATPVIDPCLPNG